MDEPIISPWFFYFADLAEGLSTVCVWLFVISILLSFLLIVSFLPIRETESEETKSKFARLVVICFAVITFFGMASVFIPSTKTCYKMLVASFVTKENLSIVTNEAKSSIDYIIEKIIDAAARLQGVKVEAQNEQKEQSK